MTCGERNREIIALYESGMSKAEIQERMGVTVYSLNKIIDAYAKKGDAIFNSHKSVYKHAKSQMEMIKRLRAEGRAWDEIVQITGVSRSSVYRLLLDAQAQETTEDDILQHDANTHRAQGTKTRDEIEIGDTVMFRSRGREVVAVVKGKYRYTLSCAETLLNGLEMVHSPQYQDVEIIQRNHNN